MRSRASRSVMALAALTVLLTACSGLPTTGSVYTGLAVGAAEDAPDFTQLAADPVAGAGPEEIVDGFLDAAITPDNNWEIARKFLSPELAETWRPNAGVTIDASAIDRTFSSNVPPEEAGPEDEEEGGADTGEVQVLLDQIAGVDARGAYAEFSGDTAIATFEVARNADGEWRITAAEDGIVLDAESFQQVYDPHALQFFDPSWTHLVPEVRWYPRRATIPTTLTHQMLAGPSDWLAPGVRTAFPSDVALAREAVPVREQVAEVELTDAALMLDATTLARMRTQLEQTLASAGVSEVRLLVNGRDLNAGRATVEIGAPDVGTLVLTADGFGSAVGDEVNPLPGISAEVQEMADAVAAVDVSIDGERAAVQLTSGAVVAVSGGNTEEIDTRLGLVRPSIDPFGYTWTVPASAPQAVVAVSPDGSPIPVAEAWPNASAISQLRIGPDGARVAAVVTVGGQRWIAVAAIVRGADGVPTELGPPHLLALVDGAALGMSWLGDDTLALLVRDEDSRHLLTQRVGGPGAVSAVPADAVSIAGARTPAGLRLQDAEGVVFAQRITTWQESLTGVRVLGTYAGQ